MLLHSSSRTALAAQASPAQGQSQQPAAAYDPKQQEELDRRPVSPYEIRRYVLEHRDHTVGPDYILSLENYWLRLGIPVEEWRGYGRCKVDLFRVALSSGSRDDVLLRLYDDSGWSWGCRYLLFRGLEAEQCGQTQWTFLGAIDLTDQRYGLPEDEVVEAGNKRWLAIKMLVGRGSGYNSYAESLYEITANGFDEVLTFPSHRYISGEGVRDLPSSLLHGRIINTRASEGGASIVVEITITYSVEGMELWKKRQRATFNRDADSSSFELDPTRSDITEEEIDDVFDSDMWLPKDKMIKYYNKELTRIALGNNTQAKEWLARFLPEFSPNTHD